VVLEPVLLPRFTYVAAESNHGTLCIDVPLQTMGQSKLPRSVHDLGTMQKNGEPKPMGVHTRDSRVMVNTSATTSFSRDSLYPNMLAIICKILYMIHVYTVAINGNTRNHHCI
jgi:hypothetical protein